MLAIRENSVYTVSGKRNAGIALVEQIVNEHVFGRVLLRDKETGEFFQRDFHSSINTVGNHQNFVLWNGRRAGDGIPVTVEACDCVAIDPSFI